MATPDDVTVWVGIDIGKAFHHAVVVDDTGKKTFDRKVPNNEPEIVALIDAATKHGTCAVIIDQIGSLAVLVVALAFQRDVPVAYIPGLVMRRAADLYPGNAKTDKRDAFILADTARSFRHRVQWLQPGDDLLVELRSTAETPTWPLTSPATPTASATP